MNIYTNIHLIKNTSIQTNHNRKNEISFTISKALLVFLTHKSSLKAKPIQIAKQI